MIEAVAVIYVRRVSDDRWYVVVECNGELDESGPYRTREHADERLAAIMSEAVSTVLAGGVPVEQVPRPDGGFALRALRGNA